MTGRATGLPLASGLIDGILGLIPILGPLPGLVVNPVSLVARVVAWAAVFVRGATRRSSG